MAAQSPCPCEQARSLQVTQFRPRRRVEKAPGAFLENIFFPDKKSLFFSLGLTLELHEELLDSTVTDKQLSPDAQRPAWLADGSSKAGFCRNRRLLEEESELQQVAPRRIHSGSCPARHGISVKEA
ncbi:uncharacterized protein LOC126950660 isoform X2 [Macaca thibetana thibetana]|uniref:uncharacterized protein LOC126950660 isoform X2 n=1 Tax=Macaca thibetana thibetana TaxID=257877 RepID=UPI0021BCB334|nr:uncharacterized protein LOC126950660 isoform X2 [Macaca thibetana thibetana]XP_050640480.1 uncharacterized protein LOC126950660 isoform X2 [Macaca thibetana thibetana]